MAAGGDGTVHVFDDRVKRVAEFSDRGDPVLAVALTAGRRGGGGGHAQGGKLRLIRLADAGRSCRRPTPTRAG